MTEIGYKTGMEERKKVKIKTHKYRTENDESNDRKFDVSQ